MNNIVTRAWPCLYPVYRLFWKILGSRRCYHIATTRVLIFKLPPTFPSHQLFSLPHQTSTIYDHFILLRLRLLILHSHFLSSSCLAQIHCPSTSQRILAIKNNNQHCLSVHSTLGIHLSHGILPGIVPLGTSAIVLLSRLPCYSFVIVEASCHGRRIHCTPIVTVLRVYCRLLCVLGPQLSL